ncbi:hypothetical protein ACNAUS_18280, partial [Acinetobacter puyangensis]
MNIANANTINTSSGCASGSGTVYKLITPNTTGQATDGSGTFSLIAGCNASGNSNLAATALGTYAQVTGTGGTALGHNSSAAQYAIGIGVESRATGVGTVAIGADAQATSLNSIAIGRDAHVNGSTLDVSGIAIGPSAMSYAYGVALGTNATADQSAYTAGKGGIAIGYSADTVNASTSAIALGNNAIAGGSSTNGAIAIGESASSTNSNTVALGTSSSASANNAIAVGNSSIASASSTTALGSDAQATATGSTAISLSSRATGVGSTAIGVGANASGANAMALGTSTTASHANAVALGNGSVTAAAVATPNTIINDQTYSFAGTNPQSTISVGSVGNERTITNVAAGRISTTSTDAINGSQLYSTNQSVTALSNSIVDNLGGNATIDNGGITYTNIGGTGKDNINDAIAAGKTEVEQGKNITVTSDTGADGQTIYTVATAADVNFDKVTVGDATTGILIDGSSNKISNLAAGDVSSSSTDAINGSQLHAAQ